jgi:Ser/Thr protein kinase RdoA (MazF antagonist)
MLHHSAIVNFEEVIRPFSISAKIESITPTGEGHINDTFLVKTKDISQNFILQKINHKIFRDVDGLMENIARVTSHINRKKSTNPASYKLCAPELILTDDRRTFTQDKMENCWRCYTYIPHFPSQRTSKSQAFEGGKAIGEFQSMLTDLPGGKLRDTIPDFHNAKMRLENLHHALSSNLVNRVEQAIKELEKLSCREQEMLQVYFLEQKGMIPVRITHNDTKFNNILFDENQKAVAIIDLDTVMNGSILYDFGDAVRTLCNTAAEDEADLSKVNFDLELFESFTSGYLSESLSFIQNIELEYLAFSCKLLTYIMAVRFLTDFLAGDVYFKTKHPLHNYHRAVNQLKLLECMERDFEQMEEVIRKAISL